MTSTSTILRLNGVHLERTITKLTVYMLITGRISGEILNCSAIVAPSVKIGSLLDTSHSTLKGVKTWKIANIAMAGRKKFIIQASINALLAKRLDVLKS